MKKSLIEEIKAAEKNAQGQIARAKHSADSALFQAQKKGQKDLENVMGDLSSFEQNLERDTESKIMDAKSQEQKHLATELKKLNGIDSKRINQAASLAFKKLIN